VNLAVAAQHASLLHGWQRRSGNLLSTINLGRRKIKGLKKVTGALLSPAKLLRNSMPF
jgi:hypothetical protein